MADQTDADGILRVKTSSRVRFPYVKPANDSDGPAWQVVRVLARDGRPVPPEGGKVLVALRHGLTWRQALAAIALSDDRAMSAVLGRLIDAREKQSIAREGLPLEILADRGRPSSDAERTINLVVERDGETGSSFTADLVGEYCDQAYYLTESQIAKLEQLAKATGLSPGQVVDVLLMQELAGLSQRLVR